MSFSVKISPKDRATGRFMNRVHRALIKAITQAKDEKKLTQAQIAEAMGVDKSAVSRILSGEGNLTLKTIGDISWAVGLRPSFRFEMLNSSIDTCANHHAMLASALVSNEHPRMETTKPVDIAIRSVAGTRTSDSRIYRQQLSNRASHAR